MPITSPSAIWTSKIMEKLKKIVLNKTKYSLHSTYTVIAFLEIWCLLKLCKMFLCSIENAFRFWDPTAMSSFITQMSGQTLKSYMGQNKSSLCRWALRWFYTLNASHSPKLSWWPKKHGSLAKPSLGGDPAPTEDVSLRPVGLTIQSVGSQC